MRTLLTLAVIAAISGQTAAAPAPYNFNSFPVKERYRNGTARLVLISKQDKEFRSGLQAAAKQAVNFAGHYIVATFGCGSSCVTGAIIDAKTGHVAWIPFTVCCGDYAPAGKDMPLEFRRNSALMIVNGMRNEKDKGRFYYLFRQGRLKLLSEMPKEGSA